MVLCCCSAEWSQVLISAGAVVDVEDSRWGTALQVSICEEEKSAAELLLDAGAKIGHLKEDLERPDWFVAMLQRRSNCKSSALALFGLLRKRWRVGNEKVPLDMIKVLTGMVWDTRRDIIWVKLEAR